MLSMGTPGHKQNQYTDFTKLGTYHGAQPVRILVPRNPPGKSCRDRAGVGLVPADAADPQPARHHGCSHVEEAEMAEGGEGVETSFPSCGLPTGLAQGCTTGDVYGIPPVGQKA